MITVSRSKASDLPSDIIDTLTSDSFFGSIGFGRLWTEMGGEPVYWAAEHSGRIVALLPGVEFGRKPVKRFQSMPDGCYGRLYFDNDKSLDRAQISAAIKKAIAGAGYARSFIYDFYGNFAEDSDYTVQPCRTLTVNISDSDWQPPDKKLQSEIRKAVREKVEFCRFDLSRHLDRFITLMEDTEKRHGREPKYSRSFFQALAKLAQSDKRIIWYWCEHEGKPVTSHINFIESAMALNWQVYYDKAFSFLKANQLLLTALASEAREQGAVKLNLGASPPEAGSLAKYKAKWGGVDYEYSCHRRQSILGKAL